MVGSLSDTLRRFRPTVAPGPAGRVGVPADRVAEAEAELAGVIASLGPVSADAERVRAEARAEADRRRRQGREHADRIVAEARSRLDAVRADAAATGLAALDAERAEIEAGATAEVERVRRVADARRGDLVADVVAGVWATAGVRPGAGAPSGEDEESW